MQLTLRVCLLEQQFKAGTTLTVVEPVALERDAGGQTDTFGHDEKLVVINCDGLTCTVRSPRTLKKYVSTLRVLERATSASSSPHNTTRPVPATLRGKRMY